jgi:hypothetical protein
LKPVFRFTLTHLDTQDSGFSNGNRPAFTNADLNLREQAFARFQAVSGWKRELAISHPSRAFHSRGKVF